MGSVKFFHHRFSNVPRRSDNDAQKNKRKKQTSLESSSNQISWLSPCFAYTLYDTSAGISAMMMMSMKMKLLCTAAAVFSLLNGTRSAAFQASSLGKKKSVPTNTSFQQSRQRVPAAIPSSSAGYSQLLRPTSNLQLNGFFGNFLDQIKKEIAPAKPIVAPKKYDAVVIDPDFRIAGVFLALGILLDQIPYIQFLLGLPVTALGLLFLVQTFRLRFVFDEENCLELKTTNNMFFSDQKQVVDDLNDAGENVIVGGRNRWKCDTIVNYDFFPKGWIDDNPIGPVLVYFKETQTDSSTWNEGPGKSANDPVKIAAGTAVAGQVHFFPTVCNAQQIRAEFAKRACGKVE